MLNIEDAVEEYWLWFVVCAVKYEVVVGIEIEDVDEHDEDEDENEDDGGVRETLDNPVVPWWLLFDLLTLLCGGQFWFVNLFSLNVPDEFSSELTSNL